MMNEKQMRDRMSALIGAEKYISGLVPGSQEEATWIVIKHSLEHELHTECLVHHMDFVKFKKRIAEEKT